MSKDSPKRDWYLWRPAKTNSQGERAPPNNWRAAFGGSAWEWDEPSQEVIYIFSNRLVLSVTYLRAGKVLFAPVRAPAARPQLVGAFSSQT